VTGTTSATEAASGLHRGWYVAAVLGAAVLFGTTGTAQALGPAGTTPLGVGTLRILIGAIALWCFARRWPSLDVLVRHRWLILAGGVGVALYQPAFFAGTARLGVALGTVVAIGSGPVFAGVIEWIWLRRSPGLIWAIATAVTIGGGALLVFAGDAGARFDPIGLVGSLGAGLGYAVYAISAKLLIDRGVGSTVALAWPFTIGAAVLVIGLVLVPQPLGWVLSVDGIAMLIHLGVFTVGLAYVLYGWGLRAVPSSSAVTLTLAEPLTAAIAAVIILEERLRPAGWFGAALVMSGLVLVGWASARSTRPVRLGV
jgi:DME family drug/metabolite transporter